MTEEEKIRRVEAVLDGHYCGAGLSNRKGSILDRNGEVVTCGKPAPYRLYRQRHRLCRDHAETMISIFTQEEARHFLEVCPSCNAPFVLVHMCQ